ncbi:MAG TPA: PH domain-containing protein [Blastocatellia bacterium]|nr:PH domain-containing protein [Blastocatellia bacterium]
MFCNKCGKALPEGSRFCNFCGAVIGAPDRAGAPGGLDSIGYPPHGAQAGLYQSGDARLESPESVVFTLRPTMVFVAIWYAIAALAVIAVAAIAGMLHGMVSPQSAIIVILAAALLAFSIPGYKHIMRRREVYTLTNHKLEMRYGIIARTLRNIPLKNIQDVTVTATAWQRILRLGDIEIDSASESGKIILSEVPNPNHYASLIMDELRRRY